MGFGFNLALIFIVLPITIILLFGGALTGKSEYLKGLGCIWIPILFMSLVSGIASLLPDNVLKKEDYYGEYIIDRRFFPGKQADWQYNNFKIKITENDSIFLYTLAKGKFTLNCKGSITTVKPYNSARLMLNMQKPNHHITATNPTTYRKGWKKFYLVFESKKFYNMYFTKGEWKKID